MASENYTKEMVQKLRIGYNPKADEETRDEQIAELAQELGRTPASVRAKLVRLQLYVAKEKKSKDGSKAETKDKIVEDIARSLGVGSAVVDSLTKATKKSLKLIRDNIKEA